MPQKDIITRRTDYSRPRKCYRARAYGAIVGRESWLRNTGRWLGSYSCCRQGTKKQQQQDGRRIFEKPATGGINRSGERLRKKMCHGMLVRKCTGKHKEARRMPVLPQTRTNVYRRFSCCCETVHSQCKSAGTTCPSFSNYLSNNTDYLAIHKKIAVEGFEKPRMNTL